MSLELLRAQIEQTMYRKMAVPNALENTEASKVIKLFIYLVSCLRTINKLFEFFL